MHIFDYLPEPMMVKVNESLAFARVLVLDKWLGNTDGRQSIYMKKARARHFKVMFIDQGYCLNAEKWDFPDLPLHGVHFRNCVYDHVTGWESFEPVLTKAEEADIIDVWRCAERVVPAWYEHKSEALQQVVEVVHARCGKIRSLIDEFRQSSRNPFPNWKED